MEKNMEQNKMEVNQFRCFRCQDLFEGSELQQGKGQASQWKYCDHCYDHMFVSWRESYQRREKKYG